MDIQKLEEFKVSSSGEAYNIILSSDEKKLIKDFHDCKFFIIDSFFKDATFIKLIDKKKIFFVDANEQSKTLIFSEKIIGKMTDLKITRECIIGVIGGGIIQDVGGFIASIYMRGIAYKLYPTTFLSLVDSCIGGKTSINTSNVKNLLGTFYPPRSVFCYSNFCNTLSKDQINQGIIEALKITFAFKDFYMDILNYSKKTNLPNLLEISRLSLYAKKKIIEEDEFDLGKRRLLNLGHTFGHSIEKASSHKIEHGYAVGLGILIARDYSIYKNYLDDQNDIHLVCESIKEIIPPHIISQFKKMKVDIFFQSLENDKKHNNEFYRFILPFNNHIKEVEFTKKDTPLKDEFLHIIQNL